jgi:hypothetical protein
MRVAAALGVLFSYAATSAVLVEVVTPDAPPLPAADQVLLYFKARLVSLSCRVLTPSRSTIR